KCESCSLSAATIHGSPPTARSSRSLTAHCRGARIFTSWLVNSLGRHCLRQTRSVCAREQSDEAIHASACGTMDCFASLAMTVIPSHHHAQPLRRARDAGVEAPCPAVLERKTSVV